MHYIDKPEQLLDFAQRLRVIELKDGAKLPVLKRGMFIVLQGSLNVLTHWKLSEGFNSH